MAGFTAPQGPGGVALQEGQSTAIPGLHTELPGGSAYIVSAALKLFASSATLSVADVRCELWDSSAAPLWEIQRGEWRTAVDASSGGGYSVAGSMPLQVAVVANPYTNFVAVYCKERGAASVGVEGTLTAMQMTQVHGPYLGEGLEHL